MASRLRGVGSTAGIKLLFRHESQRAVTAVFKAASVGRCAEILGNEERTLRRSSRTGDHYLPVFKAESRDALELIEWAEEFAHRW